MARYTHSNVKRQGLQYIKDNGDLLVILINPTKADNWATTQTKIMAQAAYTSSDMFLADVGDDVQFTSNAKADIDQSQAAADTDDIAVAVLDTVNQVVLVVQDITDKTVTNAEGDRVNIPGLNVFSRELSAV